LPLNTHTLSSLIVCGRGLGCRVSREGHVVSLVDDVENEVENGGEGCDVVLSAGGNSNRLVVVGRNNEVGIGRDGELIGVEFLLERVRICA